MGPVRAEMSPSGGAVRCGRRATDGPAVRAYARCMRRAAPALLVVLLIAGVGAAAYHVGRASVAESPARERAGSFSGYQAGREAAFSGFDGGWSYGQPYIVTLRRGGPGVTYRFARRWPMLRGHTYRTCGRGICIR
jgi:hypothetical protein